MKLKDALPIGAMLGAASPLIGTAMRKLDKSDDLAAQNEKLRNDMAAIQEERIRRAQMQPQVMKKGGKVSSASKRADGCATKGKTKGRMV